jgi:transglutaminase-like putative cysteine protease
VKKIFLGISAVIVVVGLLGAVLIFKVTPDTNVESIGYQYAVREDISNLPAIATPAGYTSFNTQSFFSGKKRVTKLALNIVDGQTTELGKAEALIDWVQLHVRPQTSAPTTVITDDYVNIIKRGWGYCDQMAHVFATMATYVGLETKQLQLFSDDGSSPHTLAMVKIDGKWRIAST